MPEARRSWATPPPRPLAGVTPAQREEAWQEISTELARFDGSDGFEGPCELIVAWGVK